MNTLITIDDLVQRIQGTAPVAGRGILVGAPSANGRVLTLTVQPSAAVYNAVYRGLVKTVNAAAGTCVCDVALDSGTIPVTVKVNKSLLTGTAPLLKVGDTFVFCSMAVIG